MYKSYYVHLDRFILFFYSMQTLFSYHYFLLTFLERGIKFLFPIQAKTYDLIYDGHDVIGKARKLICEMSANV